MIDDWITPILIHAPPSPTRLTRKLAAGTGTDPDPARSLSLIPSFLSVYLSFSLSPYVLFLRLLFHVVSPTIPDPTSPIITHPTNSIRHQTSVLPRVSLLPLHVLRLMLHMGYRVLSCCVVNSPFLRSLIIHTQI